MRIRDYEIPKALVLLVLLLIVVVGSGLYLMGQDDTETLPTTPPATTGTTPTTTATTPAATTLATPLPAQPLAPPSAFQPKKLPGAPPKRVVDDARRIFPSFKRTTAPPEGAYWLGPVIAGLNAYRQPPAFERSDQQVVVYTTPEHFVRGEGIYVRTLPPRSPLGLELARSLDRYGREGQLGPYVIISPGHVAVRVRNTGQIVSVFVVGAFVRDFTAGELVSAIKR